MNIAFKRIAVAAALLLSISVAQSAQADLFITEIAPWSSGNSSLEADWFEVTNFGSSAVNISGWKMDDNSNLFSKAVALNGISSIGAGESVIFIESSSPSIAADFKNLWFGANVPAGLQIGTYSGSGIGLSTSGDAVNLYNAVGGLQASVTFGASPTDAPYATFDNAAALNNTTISRLSAVGSNGAFLAINDLCEIGSPGAVTATPVPAAAWLLGSGLFGLVGLRRRAKNQ